MGRKSNSYLRKCIEENHLESEVLSVTRVAGVSIDVKKTITYGVVRYMSSWCVFSKLQASWLSRVASTASINVDIVIRRMYRQYKCSGQAFESTIMSGTI